MQPINPKGRLGLSALLGVLLAGAVCAKDKPREPTLLSEPRSRAFVSSLLTWEDHGMLAWYGGPPGYQLVRLQRLDSTLEVWSRPIALTDANHQAFEPRLAPAGNDAVVVWYEKKPDSEDFTALIARVDWTGQPKWFGALSHAGRSGRNPVVRTAGDGTWVAWLESADEGGVAVWTEHLGADGQPVAPAQRAGVADRETTNLNAVVDAAGQFQVVFDAKGSSRAREVQLLTIGATGAQQRTLTADDGADSVFPDIALDAGRLALCWVDAREGRRAVRLAVGAATDPGALDARSMALTRGANEVGGSYLAWSHGRLAVAWNEAGADGGIYVQQAGGNGRLRGKPVRIAQPEAGARAATPTLAPWKKGFAVGWNEYRTDEAQQQVQTSTARLVPVE